MSEKQISPRARLVLDNVERIVVTVLFVALCARFASGLRDAPANLIFLVSEGVVAAMVLMRRRTEMISVRPVDWIIGAAGTMLPMAVMPAGGGIAAGVPLMVAGTAIALGAKLSLRRSFGVVAANRGVKSGGLYGAVRHPMYLGYFVLYAGVMLINPSVWNAVVLLVWAGFQLGRINAEERILFQDEAYRVHARKVRFRLLPHVY